MAKDICFAKQPEQTINLIQFLQDEKTGEQEMEALNALKSQMVWIFKHKPELLYCKEAMLLSEVASDEEFKHIVSGFKWAIKSFPVVSADLLRYFAGCLRWRQRNISRNELSFGPLLEGLTTWLGNTNPRTSLKDCYMLLQATGTLLDAMAEAKMEGIDRVEVHEPLAEKLHELESHEEPRIAQAAEYALKALKYVPDNESPWEEFLRLTGMTVNVAVKISSGVTQMNPQQIIEAGPECFKLVEYFGKALKGGIEVWEGCEGLKDIIKHMCNRSEKADSDKKDWYQELKRLKVLIQLGSYAILQSAISGLRCCSKPQFWCGLYAELEKQWIIDEASRISIEEVIESSFKELDPEQIRKGPVHTWIHVLAESLGKHEWKQRFPKKESKIRSFFSSKSQEFKPQLTSNYKESYTDTFAVSVLLKSAFEDCPKAKGFYADSILAQYYTCGKLLYVKRLSDDDVPMENCYINLSLVEYQKGENGPKIESQWSFRKRLESEAPNSQKEIALQKLFEARDLPNGSWKQPRRIMIRGRAGVGKTTLCKKITHSFLYQHMWSSEYDRIIWIPLRKMKKYQTFEALLSQETFQPVANSGMFWEEFKNSLRPIEDSRTLFLLDGLDEIAGDQGKLSDIEPLLNRQNVIITSRPYAATPRCLNSFDLEIETVGFLDDQVEAYVDKVCNETSRNQIMEFIAQKWVMRALMRIPIQLDALCYAWEERQSQDSLTTMTALYQAIEIKLWKKDIPRMKANFEARDRSAKCKLRAQLFEMMPDTFEFIQYIAFLGLYNNIAEFSLHAREAIYQRFPKMTDDVLDDSSFIRSSDSSTKDRDQDYHFLHLTFQEYFAAQHFARSWQSGKEIETLDLETGSAISLSAEEFIASEKYNGRFNIVWRFITGILASKEKDIEKFFEQIERKPRDLVGEIHTSLLMYCFNETSAATESFTVAKLRKQMENQLLQLLVRGRHGVCVEPDFPQRILSECLEKVTADRQDGILSTITTHSQLSTELLDQIWQLYRSTQSQIIRNRAAGIIGKSQGFSTEQLIEVIFDSDGWVFSSLISGLKPHRKLPGEILTALVVALRLPWGFSAVNIVGNSELSRSIIHHFTNKLSNASNLSGFQQSVQVLANCSPQGKSTRRLLIELLDNPDQEVRMAILSGLTQHSDLSDSDCWRVSKFLDKGCHPAEKAAGLELLKKQLILPPKLIDQLWEMLGDDEYGVSILEGQYFDTLKRHGDLTEDGIVERFRDSPGQDNFAIRLTRAANNLQIVSPNTLLRHCVTIVQAKWHANDPDGAGGGGLSDDDFEMGHRAIDALESGPSLPSDIVSALWEMLDECPSRCHLSILHILAKHDHVPQEMLNEVVTHLEKSKGRYLLNNLDPDTCMRTIAKYKSLSEDTIQKLVEFACKWEDPHGPLGVLMEQNKIPAHIVEPLAELFVAEDTTEPYHYEQVFAILQKHADWEVILHGLGPARWVTLFKYLACSPNTRDRVQIYSKGLEVHVNFAPYGSCNISIEQPEQREKMEAVLDSIQQYFQDKVGDIWDALGLQALDRKALL